MTAAQGKQQMKVSLETNNALEENSERVAGLTEYSVARLPEGSALVTIPTSRTTELVCNSINEIIISFIYTTSLDS